MENVFRKQNCHGINNAAKSFGKRMCIFSKGPFTRRLQGYSSENHFSSLKSWLCTKIYVFFMTFGSFL